MNKEKTLSNEPASLILTLYASKLFCFHSSVCSLFLSYFVFIHLFVLCFKAYFLILIKSMQRFTEIINVSNKISHHTLKFLNMNSLIPHKKCATLSVNALSCAFIRLHTLLYACLLLHLLALECYRTLL